MHIFFLFFFLEKQMLSCRVFMFW